MPLRKVRTVDWLQGHHQQIAADALNFNNNRSATGSPVRVVSAWMQDPQ
jgi:hypothetical protein